MPSRKPSGRSVRPPTARGAALSAIGAQMTRFPDLLPLQVCCDGLDARDGALARALYDTVIRRWRTLTFIVSTRIKRPYDTIEPSVRTALLAGATQLLFMDRIPDHAAINETVAWVRRASGKGAGGFVNAVLRAVASLRAEADPSLRAHESLDRRDAIARPDGTVLLLKEPILPDDDLERLAIVSGIPHWQVARWASRMGMDTARAVALHSLIVAPVIVNCDHARAPLGGMEAWEQHEEAGFRIAPPGDSLNTLGHRDDVWVQDSGSARAVASLGRDTAPALIVDMCAGKGGKTRQLAAQFLGAQVVATDVDRERLGALRRAATGLANVRVCEKPGLGDYAGRADLIVLDVPCSNSGVLARRLEARHRCSQKQLDRLLAIQRQILADAMALLAPAGRILYCTCSLEPEECQGHAQWAKTRHALHVASEDAHLPTGEPGGSPRTYRDGASWMLFHAGLGR